MTATFDRRLAVPVPVVAEQLPECYPVIADTETAPSPGLEKLKGQVERLGELAARWALQANLGVVPMLREVLAGEWGRPTVIGGLPHNYPLLQFVQPIRDSELFGSAAQVITMVRFDPLEAHRRPRYLTDLADLQVSYVTISVKGVRETAAGPERYGDLIASIEGRSLGL